MIGRLGARKLARPARHPGYLTAKFVLVASPIVFGIALLLAGPAQAQAPATVPPERVKQLFELLDDPSVKAWVAEQRNQGAGSTEAPAEAGASPAAASSDAVVAPGQMNTMASSTLDRIKIISKESCEPCPCCQASSRAFGQRPWRICQARGLSVYLC
ncbi:hypothetical protein AJ88_44985 [Mesorhizobium amorphae CCBAU 01583]|nr:hypothetical protein AJ88_44985 [Mesorhizobium amorphae CCBAU 01583]